MDENYTVSQNVDTLFTNLENFTQNEGLIGKPVTHGDKTFLPVVTLTLGYGTGNTASKNQGSMSAGQSTNPVSGLSNMAGGALGLGAKLSTDAIIVIDNDKISMMQMSSAGSANQIVDKIPQILSGMTGGKQQGQQQGQQQQGQQ